MSIDSVNDGCNFWWIYDDGGGWFRKFLSSPKYQECITHYKNQYLRVKKVQIFNILLPMKTVIIVY